jgi:DNA-binding MarR family transcriptional regulator
MRLRVQPVVYPGIIRAMDAIDQRALELDDPGMRAWARFLHAHATIVRRLEAELQGERDMGLGEFEALLQLSLVDDGRLRMSELADRLVLSRSGVTRLVDRLEAARLVARVSCPSDARGAFAQLTDVGRARLRDAAPTHVRGVREHFVDAIPADELESLTRTLERLADPDRSADAACATVLATAGEGTRVPVAG